MIYIFKHDQVGAPVTGISAGTFITFLDSILINGYGSSTVSSLTRSGTTVLATTSITHGLDNISICEIAGATQTEYNGKFAISWMNTTQFTYQITGTPAITATGTITCKRAGAGWTKPYTTTNQATYKMGSGSGRYLAVNNTVNNYATVRGFDTCTAAGIVATAGTIPFPNDSQGLGGSVYFPYTNSGANATTWTILASENVFYGFFAQGNNRYAMFFGDTVSYKSGETYATTIVGHTGTYAATGYENGFNVLSILGNTVPTYTFSNFTCKDINGNAVSAITYRGTDTWRNGQCSAPVGPTLMYNTDGTINFAPIWLSENTNGIRGHFPGVYAILAPYGNFPYNGILTVPSNNGILSNKILYIQPVQYATVNTLAAHYAFDITNLKGTWWD